MTDSPQAPATRRALTIRGLVLLHPLDLIISLLVLAFFVGSALVSGGDVVRSMGGGLLIMLVMFVVGASIEVIIDALRDLPGLGTAVGFITNGPEMLVLVVGLLAGDVVFAASTPLGSNFMNPVLLLAAAVATGTFAVTIQHRWRYTWVTVLATAFLAALFFALPERLYLAWLLVVLTVSITLFLRRPGDPPQPSDVEGLPRWSLLPALLLLVVAGYWLDPVVNFTAEASHAPKGLIGFLVLAALTSWPEFRSCLSLLRRGRTNSAVLNITVSNITNLWLAALGVAVHLVVGH